MKNLGLADYLRFIEMGESRKGLSYSGGHEEMPAPGPGKTAIDFLGGGLR